MFQPVEGTTWMRAAGQHGGSTYEIMAATPTTVRVRELRSMAGGSHSPGHRHKWPRDQFLRMFVPATTRDEKACLTIERVGDKLHVPMEQGTLTIEKAIKLQKVEERTGAQIVPIVMDTNSAGDPVEVKLALRRCAGCSQEKPLGAFNVERSRKDGLAVYCKPCKKEQNAAYQARLRAERQQQQERPAVTLTTTSNGIIEQRQVEAAIPSARIPRNVFRVRLLVMEEKEITVEADTIPEAYTLAQNYATSVEVVSVSLIGNNS